MTLLGTTSSPSYVGVDEYHTVPSGFLSSQVRTRPSGYAMGASTLAGLAGCSSPSDSSTSSTTSKETSFDGNFVVGFDQEFPPYGYVGDDGTYTGFDLDLAQAVCAMESWTYTPTPISWDAKDALLNSGQITCIWNGFTIEGREGDYAFTDAYMKVVGSVSRASSRLALACSAVRSRTRTAPGS